MCGARAPCSIVEIDRRAGVGSFVIQLTTARADDASAACVPYEHWLVRAKGAAIVERRELLRVCNDGYGAAGVGEDRISVEPGRFVHVQRGGSSWRWENGRTLDLDPLRLARVSWWSGSTVAAVAERGAFDWLGFRGRARWYRPPCPPGGGPPPGVDADETSIVDRPADPRAYVYDPLPVVELPESFRAGGFATTALGSCAPPIDGAEDRGFVVLGPPGDDRDARLRAVVARTREPSSPLELYLELADDVSVGPSARWLLDDHVEIWLQDEDPDPSELCLPTAAGAGAGALRQWAIRLADGKVFPGLHAAGQPNPLVVARAEGTSADGRAVTRLKVAIAPPAPQGITVVFSDSDDGKAQERLLATSQLVFGKAATLGRLWPVDPKDAVCVVEHGALDRRLTRALPGSGPVLGD